MLPYKSLIEINRTCRIPVYVQLAGSFINLIQKGHLRGGTKLPGSRKLSELLSIHRNTAVNAYDELSAQGWIEIIPRRGTFVAACLPIYKAKPLKNNMQSKANKEKRSDIFYQNDKITPPYVDKLALTFDDGAPDTRLAPIQQFSRAYSGNLRKVTDKRTLSYVDPRGDYQLRSTLAKEFNLSRGLDVNPDQIMITKGSQMGMFLLAQACIRPGDHVVVGQPNYYVADMCFEHLGAKLIRIPVDKQGLVVSELEDICKHKKIKAIYITSHHHHPTTVTLSPDRRLSLLALAETYRFLIIEDDYDYDFHYDNSPILPLASADQEGLVAYIGSFSKTMAPAFRIGYIIGSEGLIQELIKIRRIIDRQGDPILEKAFAQLIEEGTIRNHLRKSLRIYKTRRDACVSILRSEFSDFISFDVPNGGLAIWIKFAQGLSLSNVSKEALKRGLHISDGSGYLGCSNATRMGFASIDEKELNQSAEILKDAIATL